MDGKENRVYINGKLYPKSEAKISVYDHGLLYGDGVFEGIRVYDGAAFKLREHVDRLYDSAHAIGIDIPMKKEGMIGAVLETLKANKLKEAYVRLLVTRGSGDLGLDPRKCSHPMVVIITEPLEPTYGVKSRDSGITAIIASTRRDLPDATTHEIKSLNYLNSIMAKLESIEAGVDEAIMLNSRGFVSESTTTNIFIVKNGRLLTPPPTAGILHGITRSRVMQLASNLGYEVLEREITPFELLNADEVFLCGTRAEIVPVIKISGRIISTGKVGPITKKLIGEFQKVVRDPREGVPLR